MIDFDDDELEKLIRGIYRGTTTPERLSKTLYASIAEKLKEGIYQGFGGTVGEVGKTFGYGSAPVKLLNDLRENIYLFSAAKTFQQTEEMRGLLVENGKVLPYAKFKEKSVAVFGKYNDTWLATEYNTAIGQAESARKWSDIIEDKDLFPRLKYVAVMDDHTSEICGPLNGLVFDVSDPIVQKISPLNHYGCRCLWLQFEKSEARKTSKVKADRITKGVLSQMDDSFKMNPGKTGEVFSKDHPYFTDVPKEYRNLAKQNFNLPIPKVKKNE